MLCAIWYHLLNLKDVKNTLKVTFLHGCFSGFLNCTNGTKLRNASHICTNSRAVISNVNKAFIT